jgi:antitoxin component YwqK of YwqJK toxin-antitoxin module
MKISPLRRITKYKEGKKIEYYFIGSFAKLHRRTQYYPNGSVHFLVHFKNGKPNGEAFVYSKSGKLCKSIVYKDGNAVDVENIL